MLLKLGGKVDAEALLLGAVVGKHDGVVAHAEAEVTALQDTVEVAGPWIGQRRDQCVLFELRRGQALGAPFDDVPQAGKAVSQSASRRRQRFPPQNDP
jgi:hypothetical protein